MDKGMEDLNDKEYFSVDIINSSNAIVYTYTTKVNATGYYNFDYTATTAGTYTWRFRRVSLNGRSTSGIAYFDDFKVSSTILQSQQVCSSPKNYRFGFNTQEKDDEVYGAGNLNTAQFWEYDTRLGRRWNVDPKPNISISPYAAFANNPIIFSDYKGDTIKVSFFNKASKKPFFAKQFTKYLNKNQKNDGVYFLGGHGAPNGIQYEDSKGMEDLLVTAEDIINKISSLNEQFAQDIKDQKNITLILGSCLTGLTPTNGVDVSIAQQIRDKYKFITVVAPNDFVSYSDYSLKKGLPMTTNGGKYTTFNATLKTHSNSEKIYDAIKGLLNKIGSLFSKKSSETTSKSKKESNSSDDNFILNSRF
jgi:hypothetical protein